jgi:hypothetical protein
MLLLNLVEYLAALVRFALLAVTGGLLLLLLLESCLVSTTRGVLFGNFSRSSKEKAKHLALSTAAGVVLVHAVNVVQSFRLTAGSASAFGDLFSLILQRLNVRFKPWRTSACVCQPGMI